MSYKKVAAHALRGRLILFFLPVFAALAGAEGSDPVRIALGRGGKAECVIEISDSAIPAERTAAEELQGYLGRIIGEEPAIVKAGSNGSKARIIVGHTDFTRASGIDVDSLGPEEWIIKTADSRLLLTGGRPRGSLYAVYRFLEDELGVRWWNPWEETVPLNPDLVITGIDRRGEPAFAYRDVFVLSLRDRPELYSRERERFAVRNRLNRYGHTPIHRDYGGSRDYGPPHHVHTFYRYIPPGEYFESNPEFFSLIDGKRTADTAQLCLSNRELREVFIRKLKQFIDQGERRAESENLLPPEVYSISPNDGTGACQCDDCSAIAAREGSEIAPLLYFVNEIADSIRDSHPEVYIDTLAYWYTIDRPKNIKARDNVIIRLCDTESNYAVPLTAQDDDLFMRGWANEQFPELVEGWSQVTRNLRIWEYGITYRFHLPDYIASGSGLPFPSAHTYASNHIFYLKNNVEGVFVEKERPVLADVRDFKEWMKIKMLEDPYGDYEELARIFAEGFYGRAGNEFLEYRKLLRQARDRSRVHIGFYAYPTLFYYIDLETLLKAYELFERGKDKITGEPVLERRWRHAMLSMDRLAYMQFRRLVSEWTGMGYAPEEFPLDLEEILSRFKKTFYEQVKMRIIPERRDEETTKIGKELALYGILNRTSVPEKFRDVPGGRFFDITADFSHYHRGIVKMVEDSEAESGFASRLDFPNSGGAAHSLENHNLPIEWGIYSRKLRTVNRSYISEDDVPGPGYNWYKMGVFNIGPSSYIYLLGWILQKDVTGIYDAEDPGREYEVWARIKFEGPAFPYGAEGEADAISVERVILVKR